MAKVKQSKQSRVLATLQSGKELTTKQIAGLGLANPTACVSQLRQSGFTIYTNKRVSKSGETVNAYRMNVK